MKKLNENKEIAPLLEEGNKVQIKIDKRGAKIKDKFVTVEVSKDNNDCSGTLDD